MKFKSLILLIVSLFILLSCDSGVKLNNPNDPNNRISQGMGELGKECYPNNTCNKGLVCDEGSSTCIKDSENADDDKTDTASENDDDKTDTVSDNDEDQTDTLPETDDHDSETPDDIIACPNGCSGFGECDFTTGKCTCTENHGGEDCSECAEGYHLEAVDDDEDGDGVVSCAPNQTCDPNPCHNNGCKVVGNTAVCTCNAANHQGGRWCEGCAEGYIKSNSDGRCKEDCSLKTCTYPQKCGVDPVTNEAGCGECENEFYTGANCTSCDTAHFCNGHATACVVEGTTEKCTCETGYTGSVCGECAEGYFPSGGSCIKSCDTNKCFKTHTCSGTSAGIEMTSTLSGHGTCSNTTGECICDPGWKTGTSDLGQGTTVQCGVVTVFETLNNVECAICDKNNPPSQYASTGCPQSLAGDDEASLCNSIYSLTCGTGGSCYYEPTGSHQLYCVCNYGYHLDNGDKYTGYCVEDETPDE